MMRTYYHNYRIECLQDDIEKEFKKWIEFKKYCERVRNG